MIINNYEYNNYIITKKNTLIYSCFQNIFGFGKTNLKQKLFYKCLGLNLKYSYDIKNISLNQHKINIYILITFLFNKIGAIVLKKYNYFKNNKYPIGSNKYIRKISGLPLRGQRTRTNAKTCKKLHNK